MLAGKLRPGVMAWTTADRVNVWLIPEYVGTRSFRAIVLHELGHSLGLAISESHHSNVPDTLMASPGEITCECVDRYTLMQLADRMRWDFRRMRGCDHPRMR